MRRRLDPRLLRLGIRAAYHCGIEQARYGEFASLGREVLALYVHLRPGDVA
jgi:hypothetical protein